MILIVEFLNVTPFLTEISKALKVAVSADRYHTRIMANRQGFMNK